MKRNLSDRVFDICNVAFMIIISLIFIIPLLYIVSGSFMHESEFLRRGYSLIPERFDLRVYKIVLNDRFGLLSAFKDTFIVASIGTFGNLFFTSAMAFGLSKRDLAFRKQITAVVFFTMLFGGGMIPTYMVVRGTGLLNSYWALIIPTLISPWNMFILRNFFMAIPPSLTESAMLDGANEVRILYKIILPLSLPAIATIGLFYAVAHWNSWFENLLYIPNQKIMTIQFFLRIVLSNNINQRMQTFEEIMSVPTQQLQMATLVVATVPIIMVYPFIQKYFVKGVMIGSIKG